MTKGSPGIIGRTSVAVVLALLMAGCGSDSTVVATPEVVGTPTLTTAPNAAVPLTAVLAVNTNFPTRVTVTMDDGVDAKTLDFPTLETNHTLPLLGLKAARTYQVSATLRTNDGFVIDAPDLGEVVTGPLPAAFPTIELRSSVPAAMEPGLTLFSLRHFRNDPDYLVIVDETGEVVWYYIKTEHDGDARQLDNGNLLFLEDDAAHEMDLLGNFVSRWYPEAGSPPQGAIAVPGVSDNFHHEIFPTSFGTYLTLGTNTRTVADYPTSTDDPNAPTQVADVIDDVVIEFSATGDLLNEWSMMDILDPTRISYSSLTRNNDWAHSNAVIYDDRDDSIIVSLRHQDAVVKFSRATGDLIWILGNHDNWGPQFQAFLLTPVGTPFDWQYHQHAPVITPSGNLLLFDNGNFRASPFDGRTPTDELTSYSRAVEYAIDETNMEISQVWDYGTNLPESIYARFICDADWQDTTGNVIVTFGGIIAEGGVLNADRGLGEISARIIEVDRNSMDQTVFELAIYSDIADYPEGWMVYRSERIPGLYR